MDPDDFPVEDDDDDDFFDAEVEEHSRKYKLKVFEVCAERAPMDVKALPAKYWPSSDNLHPPIVHRGIPVAPAVIVAFAKAHNVNEYRSEYDHSITHKCLKNVAKLLSGLVDCEITIEIPFQATADSQYIAVWFSNYRVTKEIFILGKDEAVVEGLRKALALDKSKKPKWYFNNDNWKPPGARAELLKWVSDQNKIRDKARETLIMTKKDKNKEHQDDDGEDVKVKR